MDSADRVLWSTLPKQDPGLAEAWYDLGAMHRANHKNEKAIASFKHYLTLTKRNDPATDKRVQADIEALGGEVTSAPE